ncbi:CapA family protein [Clostridium sp.]|uniref:CapA family protein n=1 Tax=Clostridium sp. TaxID=1506 RepID=UPI001ECB49E4|nr:CapA family protein [Clostridium sp.]MBS5884353.1 CapA family protein [Clostridium sp.]MDU7242038.1 CapA family protein [Clostridium sp.]
MKGNGKKIILLIAMFIIVAVGVFFIPRVEIILNNFNNKAMENTDNISSDGYQDEDIEVEGNDIKTIEIVATGDFLIHKEILETQYNEQSDTYDFKNTIQYVKDYLNNADLTIVNMEGTLSGLDNYGYSGYPSFNAPDELADAMKWVGVDVVNNMNNHSLDRDVRGFNRTRSVLKERSFDIIGTRESTNDNRYLIKDVNGIKVGIISYSYSMTAEGGARGLNGTSIPEELYPLMNTFREDTLDLDFQEMKEQILDMRNNGAEVIIFYMHWGDEYELEPNSTQIKIAKFLANQNVDIIFGTHPHSLQPIDIIESEDGTNETAVIYSMGNFLSSQRTERIQNPYTEDGVIVSVRLSKNTKTNEIKIEYPTYIPTWVNWYEKDGRLFYEVVPSTINDTDYLTEEGKGRVIESLNRTRGIIEKYSDKIKIRE